MKTTIEINDDLARQAKALAAEQHSTLREIIERGLRLTLRESKKKKAYKLEDKSVQGNGLQSEFKNSAWLEIREAGYGDRGQ